MSDVIEFPAQQESTYGTEFIGPFPPEWQVATGGYRVPHLTAHVQDDTVHLLLDKRFAVEGTKEEVSKWVAFIAECMAVAAGYSCHGENSIHKPNPFKLKMMGISKEGVRPMTHRIVPIEPTEEMLYGMLRDIPLADVPDSGGDITRAYTAMLSAAPPFEWPEEAVEAAARG